MNSSKVLMVGRFKRFFESMERHLCRAEDNDVRFALQVQSARRSNGWKKSKNGEFQFKMAIPNSWAFRKMCHVHRVYDKGCHYCNLRKFGEFGLETLNRDEKQAFVDAFPSTFSKLSV